MLTTGDTTKICALVGHFPLKKYQRFFDPEYTVTSVREPLSRAASEYLHLLRESRFEGSFQDFIRLEKMQDLKSSWLGPLERFGFVGIAERYSDSIAALGDKYGLRTKAKFRHVAPDGGTVSFLSNLNPTVAEEFYELNTLDVDLYKNAVNRLEEL